MESSQIILDTNIWVSFFNRQDSKHIEAVKIVSKLKMVILPHFIFQESLTVLKVKSNLKLALDFYTLAQNNENISIENINIDSSNFYSDFLLGENKNLSYIDASLLLLHKSKKYKVITFDKNLLKLISRI